MEDLNKEERRNTQTPGPGASGKGTIGGMAARPRTNEELIDHFFTYHTPTENQFPKYEAIRDAAKYFGMLILKNTPPGADQTDAIRKLRECVMTANASIALGPQY